jgi:Holliday junction resolvasome RuvABC endonuclease subunit
VPRILALDLSLRATGICTADETLLTFSPKSDDDERLDEIAERVRDLAAHADLVVMEDIVFMTNKAGQLGMVHGAVRLQLMRKSVPYVVVAPASLKKYATGKGSAKKEEMIVHWNKRTGQMVTDNNQADAAWLHAMAKDYYKEPRFPVPFANRVALGAVAWPELSKKPRRQCAKCGATDKNLPDGVVWVQDDLCSACEVPPPKVRQTSLDDARAGGDMDYHDETINDPHRRAS